MELFLIIWALMGVISAMLAASNGKNIALYAVLGFLFGPIGIIFAALPPKE